VAICYGFFFGPKSIVISINYMKFLIKDKNQSVMKKSIQAIAQWYYYGFYYFFFLSYFYGDRLRRADVA